MKKNTATAFLPCCYHRSLAIARYLLIVLISYVTNGVGQNTNHAMHDNGIIAPGRDIVNINKHYLYLDRLHTCCPYVIATVLDSSAKPFSWNLITFPSDWGAALRLIKADNNSCLALFRVAYGCDQGGPVSKVCRLNATGSITATYTVPYTSPAISASDMIVYPDGTYYLIYGAQLFHFMQNGQFDTVISANSGSIVSALALQNGHILVHSHGTAGVSVARNAEISVTGSVIAQQNGSSLISEFIEGASGSLYGLGSGKIRKYSPALMISDSSDLHLPVNLLIADFTERHDSLFVTGVDTSSKTPFYRILGPNFATLYQTSSGLKNVTPVSLIVKDDMVTVVTRGASKGYNGLLTFESVYRFPLTGSFVATADIGVSSYSVVGSHFYMSSAVVYPTYTANVTVKNYGKVPVHSFYLNQLSNNQCYYFHKYYAVTIMPDDSVTVNTGSFYGSVFSVPVPTYPSDIQTGSMCFFTTVPDSTTDTDINNDEYCSSFTLTGISTGITEQELNVDAAQIFPNPFSDRFQLDSDVNIGRLEIYNSWGSVVSQLETSQRSATINCSNWPPGIYFLKLDTEKGMVIKKAVKH